MAKSEMMVLERAALPVERMPIGQIKGSLAQEIQLMQAVALAAQVGMQEVSATHRRALWEMANTDAFARLVKKALSEEPTSVEAEALGELARLYLKYMGQLTGDAGEKIAALAKEAGLEPVKRGFLARLLGE